MYKRQGNDGGEKDKKKDEDRDQSDDDADFTEVDDGDDECDEDEDDGVDIIVPGKINIRKIMDMVNDRRRDNGFEPFNNLDESGLIEKNDFKRTERNKEHSIDESMLDETAVFDFRELEREEDRIEGMAGEIRTRGVLQFVLLECRKGEWVIPDSQTFHDLINRVECNFLREKSPLTKVLRWTNLWGSIGLLGLSAKSRPRLREFRDALSERDIIKGKLFSSIPKDVLMDRTRLCTLLRTNHRSFDLNTFSDGLFSKNSGLRGQVGISHTKTYGPDDKTTCLLYTSPSPRD